MHIKGLENIQATIGTCMKNLKNNQESIGTCTNLGESLKNMETQMGQLAQSVREQPPKSFPSNTETNPKQCMAITLRSGKKLAEPKSVEKDETQVQQEILDTENRRANES